MLNIPKLCECIGSFVQGRRLKGHGIVMSLERLISTINKSHRRIIGLMSGMSMDGVDLAYAEICGSFPDLKVKLIGAHARPYAPEVKRMLMGSREGTVYDVCQLNFLVAEEFSECVNEFLALNSIDAKAIDAIGSHGQTICHVPRGTDRIPSTLQVGSSSIIAEMTGIPTIANFRVRDMAVGGEGAPLIPLVDYILYRDSGGVVALNNLGSISNVTVVTPELDHLTGFDTGPANMPIDFFAKLIPGNDLGIDCDGALSSRGRIIPDLLNEMMQIPFIAKSPPKAAGYEEFGPVLLRKFQDKYSEKVPMDLLRTAVEFSALSISYAYKKFILPHHQLKHVTFTGGGCYNQTLMKRIRELLPELNIRELNEKDKALNDCKEGLGFAILAHETLSGRPGNVPSATGANKAVVLGELAP
ncbi:MAG: anhydro-N-acetylmuramic acid kinase [Bdellovibrio sp.]|nr:MAG: anhydro-N-acetylmuramic acid kinase [Bdellovibrio sp.]